MKKKSPSQSAFLNLRIVIGLAVFLSGICLALAGLGTFANASHQSKQTAQRSGGKSATAANLLTLLLPRYGRPERSVFTSR